MADKKPKLTYLIILICLIVFFIEFFIGVTTEDISEFFKNYGFSLENVQKEKFWVFFTSIFLHGDSGHLILNMIALFFFGRIVEIELGWKKFLLIFFVSALVGEIGILASTFFGLLSPNIPTIGISAAVFGLMGTAMLVKPFEFVFYPYLIPIPLVFVAIFYTLYNIAAFLIVTTTDVSSNISYISHISGLAAGMFFGFREEKSKKGFVILIILLTLLILIPFLWKIYVSIEPFNYLNIITELFK
jgi:membrane associated rhomboid family serine protease